MFIDTTQSVLLIIDVQNDFCDGGALAVQDGQAVIEPLNAVASHLAAGNGRVIATQDWHPADHVSFASAHPGAKLFDQISLALPIPAGGPATKPTRYSDEPPPAAIDQTLWPDHCVQGQHGADFHPALNLKAVSLIIRKGFRRELDSYSAFFENDRLTSTGLEGYLRGLGIATVFIGGLATDYCVLYTALDAVRLGLQTIVISDAVRAVDQSPAAQSHTLDRLRQAGVNFMDSEVLR